MIEPYYSEGGITIYCGDARDILPEIGPVGVVITDPPYSTGRSEAEFCASGNIAVCLDMASRLTETMFVFGTSSGRGIEFIRSSIRRLPHCRVLVWHRSYVNSPAAGPWRWDLVFIHGFGKAAFGRPEESSLIQTDGTQSLAIETGHPSPVPVSVMRRIYKPFEGKTVLDPFMGSGPTLLAAKALGGKAIGIDMNEKYCAGVVERLRQQTFTFTEAAL